MHRGVALLGGLAVVSAAVAGTTGAVATTAPPVLAVATNGHVSHPVWYHDSTAVKASGHLFVAWNTDAESVSARSWSLKQRAWSGRAVRISTTALDCRCVDSTGQNPNRHDVPTLFADPAGRVYAMYGGGTASRIGTKIGPFFRAAARIGEISSWQPERRLSVPGAVYDLEAVRDNHGLTHLVGQQGDNSSGAGSLLSMRFLPGTTSSPGGFDSPLYRALVGGGSDPSACAWQAKPGCNIFVIGRIAVGPADAADSTVPSALYVIWGWSEKNLSGTCGDPAGFCNRGLYLAESLDGGTTWSNVQQTASTNIASGPIAYDDARYQVVDPTGAHPVGRSARIPRRPEAER